MTRSVRQQRRAVAAAKRQPETPAPCIGRDPSCPCHDGLACHYRDAEDGTKGRPVPVFCGRCLGTGIDLQSICIVPCPECGGEG